MEEEFIHNRYGWCYYDLTDVPFIYGLQIHEEHRRMGHAKRLLGMVIGAIRQDGYDGVIRIEAIPQDDCMPLYKLIEFYESLGLEVINGYRNAEG